MVTRVIDRNVTVGRSRIGWGAIFAGTVVSLGVWVLLYALGLAVGFTAVSPTDMESLRAAGIGTGIWSVIAPLIALFLGGLVVSRESGVSNRLDGAIHGAVLWGLTALLGLFLIGSLIGSIVGGAARFVGGTVGTAAEAATGAAGAQGDPLQALGLSSQDLVAPINERLRAEGRPEVSPAGLQAALQDVVGEAVRTGDLNRSDVVAALSANTALSPQDAQAVAAQVESQWATQSSELRQRAAGAAETATDATAGTLWAVSIALLLSLLTAVLGGMLGVSRRERELAERPAAGHGEFAPAH